MEEGLPVSTKKESRKSLSAAKADWRAPSARPHLTGLRKKMMDDTITTTRLTQLPTEWVTGDTRCSTRYDTCGQPSPRRPAVRSGSGARG